MNKPNCLIIDIDNTFVIDNIKTKIPELNIRKAWDKFHEEHLNYAPEYFRPNINVIDLISRYYNSFEDDYKPILIFLTAREDANNGLIRYNTTRLIEKFFTCQNFKYILLMREFDDFRNSFEVKEDLLKQYVLPKYNPILAFDDDLSNVKMFRSYNITTLQICLGEIK